MIFGGVEYSIHLCQTKQIQRIMENQFKPTKPSDLTEVDNGAPLSAREKEQTRLEAIWREAHSEYERLSYIATSAEWEARQAWDKFKAADKASMSFRKKGSL